jgi:hypothetical protein
MFVHRFRSDSNAVFDTMVVNKLYNTSALSWHVTLNRKLEVKEEGIQVYQQ